MICDYGTRDRRLRNRGAHRCAPAKVALREEWHGTIGQITRCK